MNEKQPRSRKKKAMQLTRNCRKKKKQQKQPKTP